MKEATRTLGENIAFYRSQKGISQEALAEKVDVSRNTLQRWEKDDSSPSGEKVEMLCKSLGVTPNVLYGWEDDQPQGKDWSVEKEELQKLADNLSHLPDDLAASFLMQIKGMNATIEAILR